ncbi:MAG: universal stress protein [Chloroflexota bacterium]|nr:MAG: universal stress protein [Chloroflexota bacterium]
MVGPIERSARDDFREARRKAAVEQVLANLRGESIALLNFGEVSEELKPTDIDELGMQEIPLDAIVGSVGRYRDFTRSFLPKSDDDRERWLGVQTHVRRHGLEPIKVYKVGDAYFVIDGNHRVSVARQLGGVTILATVIEVKTRVPLSAGDSPDEIIIKARYADFLEKTNLDRLRPEADLMMAVPAQYSFLLEQIDAQRYRLSLDPSREEAPYEEAVTSWYDRVYAPLVQLIRGQGLGHHFPELTETDLYVLVLKRRAELQASLDWPVDMVAVASDLKRERRGRPSKVGEQVLQAVTPDALESGPSAGRWREERLAKRPSDTLFSDILVTGRGVEADVNMMRHAAIVARREDARLLALRVLKKDAHHSSDWLVELRDLFHEQCRALGVRGEFAAETGPVAPTIVRRAAWADMLGLSLVKHTGPKTATGFGTRFNKILQRSPRPILVVPEVADSAMDRALLAYDGSPKADEALYLAAYMARNWGVTLVVVSVGGKKAATALQKARDYLSARNAEVEFVQNEGPADRAILKAVEEQQADMIVMGGFGNRSALQLVVGSTVTKILRTVEQPVFVCR